MIFFFLCTFFAPCSLIPSARSPFQLVVPHPAQWVQAQTWKALTGYLSPPAVLIGCLGPRSALESFQLPMRGLSWLSCPAPPPGNAIPPLPPRLPSSPLPPSASHQTPRTETLRTPDQDFCHRSPSIPNIPRPTAGELQHSHFDDPILIKGNMLFLSWEPLDTDSHCMCVTATGEMTIWEGDPPGKVMGPAP